MASKSPSQEGNVAGGDIVGGNVTHYHSNAPSTLRELATKLNLDGDKSAQKGFIAELEQFSQPIARVPNRNLEQKLEDSLRTDLLFDALEWKEQFSKKLIKFQFSLQAQELFVHILSKIHTFFLLEVRPRALSGAKRTEIDHLIYGLVTELYDEVGDSELRLTMTDLQGMVYFLAGNCHIDWD